MPTPRKWKNEAERKRAYRKKQKEQEARAVRPAALAAPAEFSTDDPDISPVLAAVLSTGNPNRDVLIAIRDDANALHSDRIRSVTEIEKIDREERGEESNYSDIVAWRDVFAVLPVADRVKAWRQAAKCVCPECGARMNIELGEPTEFVFQQTEGEES